MLQRGKRRVFKHLLHCLFNVKLEDGDSDRMYMDRWEDDKVRPLLIAFESYEQITNLRHLKQTVVDYILRLPKEREENRRMV